jgi:hypothetical protein
MGNANATSCCSLCMVWYRSAVSAPPGTCVAQRENGGAVLLLLLPGPLHPFRECVGVRRRDPAMCEYMAL